MKCTYLLLLILLAKPTWQANILGVFLIYGYSHMLVYSTIINELARRGHDLTVITVEKFPVDAGNRIRQIDLSNAMTSVRNSVHSSYPPKKLDIPELMKMIELTHECVFNSSEVQALLDPASSNKFDVLLVELIAGITPALRDLLQVPTIGISNANLPEMFLHHLTDQLEFDQPAKTFTERIMTWKHHLLEFARMAAASRWLDNEIQKYLPAVRKSYVDLIAELDLVFFYEIPGFQPARQLPRYIIPLGPSHVNSSVTLTQDMLEYMDESENGVVYISLGSQIQFHHMPAERQQQFFDAFHELPYNFILKCGDCEHLAKNEIHSSPNIKIVKWIDQFSVLGHPNTKAFVTHAGFQSVSEATYQAVPMIAIPCFNDQHENADMIANNEMGLQLDLLTFHSADLKRAILTVIREERYKQNMLERSIALRSQPMKALDVISFWTSYLAKHKHVKFMHGDTRHMPFIQYFNLDIVLLHLLLIGISSFIIMRRCC